MTSTNGTKKTYILVDEDAAGFPRATGDYINNGDIIGTGGEQASNVHHNSIAVAIDIGSDNRNAILVQLKAAIEHANGHNGQLVCSAVAAAASELQTLMIVQSFTGEAGNTTSVLHEATGGDGLAIASDFSGGTGDIAANLDFEIDDITVIYREHSTK